MFTKLFPCRSTRPSSEYVHKFLIRIMREEKKNIFLPVDYEGASIPTIRIKKDVEATDGLELIFENCFLFGIQKSTPVKIK